MTGIRIRGEQKDYSELKGKFDLLYDNFISKGIPVVVGEYGCVRGKDEQSRLAWLSSVAIVCKITVVLRFCGIQDTK